MYRRNCGYSSRYDDKVSGNDRETTRGQHFSSRERMDLYGGNSGRGQAGYDDRRTETLKEPPKIPVFVFPATLLFNAGSQKEQQRQILTIYNPYDFPIKFKVLSTSPEHYNVMNPDGSIKPKNCVDLILRLTHAVPEDSPIPLESKFRVQVYDYDTKQALGRKDVVSTIYFGQQQQHSLLSSSGRSEDMMSLSASPDVLGDDPRQLNESMSQAQGIDYYNSKGRHQSRQQVYQNQFQQPHPNNINYIAIVIGIICIIGLTLPNESELEIPPSSTQAATANNNKSIMSILPNYLHLTLNQKLLVAYTLGLVTMVLFRP